MKPTAPLSERLGRAVNRERLVDTVRQPVAVPSRTGEAGAALDRLAGILTADGFAVERPDGGHPAAPAVVARLAGPRPGRTLQFNGHVDTVHLPFVPPTVVDGRITGSGACDMKGGVAAAVEALRVLRDTGALPGGTVLFTANDLHEAPWGFGQQLDQLITAGCVGDAVLIPEPLCDPLPVVGRGGAVWRVTIRRPGPPVHEVMRPAGEPSVIVAGAELVLRLRGLAECLAGLADPLAGTESVFIGQIHSGEIYNQFPQECRLEGTRRWLPGASRAEMERQFRGLLDEVARATGTTINAEFQTIRDAFRLDPAAPVVAAFQEAHTAISGQPLALGPKPFMDDGNSFWALARVPAITHDPRAGHPLVMARADGVHYWDVTGKRYLDALSGIYVVSVGHNNRRVIDAIRRQLDTLAFSPPMHGTNPVAVQLANRLADLAPGDLAAVKFQCGGSEVTEAAIKLARQYHRLTGNPGKYKVVSRYLSWHGSTLGSLSASGLRSRKTVNEPLAPGFVHVFPPTCYRCPFGKTYPTCDVTCATLVGDVIEMEDPATVAAVLVEPIGHTGGIIDPPEEYLPILRELCDRHNVLLIFDEIITGAGRTGHFFAAETFGVVPDVLCTAKGIAGGYAPLSAMICRRPIADAFWGPVAGC